MPRRQNAHIELNLSIWKRDSALYFVDPQDLLEAIHLGGTTEDERIRKMGHGYKHIQELLDGKRVDIWAASFVEFGICRQSVRAEL